MKINISFGMIISLELPDLVPNNSDCKHCKPDSKYLSKVQIRILRISDE
jgi:hypothetical protein